MTHFPEDKSSQTPSLQHGVLVAVIALILGCAPFIGKVFLRSTVPPAKISRSADSQARGTDEFLTQQATIQFERALAIGGSWMSRMGLERVWLAIEKKSHA